MPPKKTTTDAPADTVGSSAGGVTGMSFKNPSNAEETINFTDTEMRVLVGMALTGAKPAASQWQAVADVIGVPTGNAARVRFTRLIEKHGLKIDEASPNTPASGKKAKTPRSGGTGGKRKKKDAEDDKEEPNGVDTPTKTPAKKRAATKKTPRKEAVFDEVFNPEEPEEDNKVEKEAEVPVKDEDLAEADEA